MRKRLPTEQELISLLQAKDKKGFDLLYQLYSKSLYAIALKIVHSPPLAEDVLQDSFLKIWTNSHAYDATKGSLFTWILNITRNTAIDKTRSSVFKQVQLSSVTPTLLSGMDQLNAAEQKIDCIGVEVFLKNLCPPQQQVMTYVYCASLIKFAHLLKSLHNC
ncbi:sigma-70 family RNA polymerase sigma factor [Rhodocytophaga aerolata]|uniref:RNA polymerase sigma factor n=1 Tax=Rhodocytophaga aerolata TaxID=455078 RepID=A0ABT8RJJ4_9BACT|nr:sigma-70 family RNA polymerase sigma factor [Rhodocytophaga aerolata]MDO1451599.1 sigma-70 family RNA polymerase sigma factor [Rhodocytophaga aerolata]